MSKIPRMTTATKKAPKPRMQVMIAMKRPATRATGMPIRKNNPLRINCKASSPH